MSRFTGPMKRAALAIRDEKMEMCFFRIDENDLRQRANDIACYKIGPLTSGQSDNLAVFLQRVLTHQAGHHRRCPSMVDFIAAVADRDFVEAARIRLAQAIVEREALGADVVVTVWATDPYRIGEHEWRLRVKSVTSRVHPCLDGRYTEYQWRARRPGEPWESDRNWPSYNGNDGVYGGCPRSLVKIFRDHEGAIGAALRGEDPANISPPQLSLAI